MRGHASLVAQHLARWHHVTLPMPRIPQLFPTLRRWIGAIPAQYSDASKQHKLTHNGISVYSLSSTLNALEQQVSQLNLPVVFCHCDLLSGNIILAPDKSQCHFIDYEYGCYSYRGFDIANHFCEWAGFDCDWSLLPSATEKRDWIRVYLQHFNKKDYVVSENDVQVVCTEVDAFIPVAHFFWAIWALVQAEISDLDFDYLSYAIMRLNKSMQIC